MKAAYYQGNRTFSIGECVPVAPQAGEVRLDVAYCGICGTDVHIYHGTMDKRVQTPQVIGHEMSGVVAEIGAGVEDLKIGDAVVIRPLDNRSETTADRGYGHICKDLKFVGIDSPGAFQASWTVPAFTVHKLPPGLDLKLAALCEPLAVACHDVKLAKIRPGELAVVLGGGPIGMLVALVARQAGARVVMSEVSPFRLQFARELGFEALSPLEIDLAQWLREESDGSGADLVFEVSGAKSAAASMTDLLAIRGRIILVAIYPQPTEINLFHFFWKELSLQGARVYEREDYEKAIDLMARGVLPLEKLITEVQPLENLPDAFARLDSNPEAMKVLIDCRA